VGWRRTQQRRPGLAEGEPMEVQPWAASGGDDLG
jgi:hypothetical protein